METIERRALEWFASGDTGTSSETIARHMLGLKYTGAFGVSEPSDGGDLARCLRLLSKIPEWAPRINEMASLSNSWAAIVPHWEELKALLAEEIGPEFERNINKSSPRTYKRICQITDHARKADGWVSFGKEKDGMRTSFKRGGV